MAKEETKEVRIKPDLEKYVNGVSGSGKRTKRADDPIAEALDGLTVDEVAGIASRMTDTPKKELIEKYAHLNVGMQRMNLGNRIRGAVNKLDAAHEKDKAVVAGLPTLALECSKPHEARDKRIAKAADEKAAREAKAAKNAEAKAAKKTSKKAPAKGKSKAA